MALFVVHFPASPNPNLNRNRNPNPHQVHFPAKYVPIGVAYTKRKMVEHGVVEKAGSAVLAMRAHAKTALQKGLETDMGKKGLELKLKMGGMPSP